MPLRLAKKAFVPVVLVPIPFVQERPSIKALEALRLVVVTPPKNVTATDDVAPRAVTVASVSASPAEGAQFVPFERQTSKPLTKTCEDETSEAKKFVAVAFVNVAVVPTRLVVKRLVVVTVPKLPFQRSEGVPSEKVRSVVGIKFEDTVPETVRVDVTVMLFTMAPPRRFKVAVATEPRFVTERRLSISVVG